MGVGGHVVNMEHDGGHGHLFDAENTYMYLLNMAMTLHLFSLDCYIDHKSASLKYNK